MIDQSSYFTRDQEGVVTLTMSPTNTSCIISKFAPSKNGRTYFRPLKGSGKKVCEARYILEQTFGRPIREGYQAQHHCDVMNCINPDHIYEGTQRQNVRDAWRRGRAKSNFR